MNHLKERFQKIWDAEPSEHEAKIAIHNAVWHPIISNKAKRQKFLEHLTGKQYPAKKCGVRRVAEELIKCFRKELPK